MRKNNIIRLGHPLLRKKSKIVTLRELRTKKFQIFLDDLAALCIKSSGAGIAAPQVGSNKRVIVVHVDPQNPRYPGKKPFPLTVIINPKITAHADKQQDDWEGDLSVDLLGMVPRFISCVVTGLDRNGNEVIFDLANDFHARVFQHEIDHLDGIMFVDRVKDTRTLSEYAMWKEYWQDKTIR